MATLKLSVSKKPPLRKTPFQDAHKLHYGLEVVACDAVGAVCSVRCLFCRYFGREEATKGKRKRTKNIKYYKAPFRPQNYIEHNTTAHSAKWTEYTDLGDSEKAVFFADLTSRSNQLVAHFETESAVLRFSFPELIVTELIGKIFFNAEDEDDDMTVARALRVFGSVVDGVFRVEIKKPMRFTLSVKHLRVGLSFRQTAAVIQQHYNVTGNSKLYGMTDAMTGTYARILVAYSFQRISNLIADPNMWGFAFACDITTHTDRSFIDQRVRVAVDSVLVNLHLLAIPMFDRHTAVVQVRLIVRVLDILSANWRDKLIGISSDGENTMTGRHGGVVTLLEKEATHSVLRVWCAAHQMDLVMKAGFAIFGSGDFVKKTKDLIVHLRRQKKLSTEMGGAAKKLTNRWLYMGNALQWIVTNHFRLEEHLGENEAVAPTPSWWVNAAVVCGITVVVNVTFVKIQGKDVLLSQQMAEIELLVDSLRKLLQVQPVPSSEFESSAIDTISTKYWLQEQHLLEFIHYQGTFIKHNMNSLGDADKSSVLRQLGKFVLHIIEGMELVQAERDSNNEAAASPA
ncbi:hypothetical protein PF005_g28659, partial [Phytophthora fragariae]